MVRSSGDRRKKNTPILVGTGYDQRSRQLEVFNLGADDYLVKPIEGSNLVARISHLVAKKQELDDLIYREMLLEKMVVYDTVSCLYNRNGINENGDRLFKNFKRNHTQFTLMVIDLDGFKLFNDIHGHMAGDDVIRRIGSALKRVLRSVDVAGRWGGDEFVVILDNCNTAESMPIASRICNEIKELYEGSKQLSASLGLSQSFDGDSRYEDVFLRADRAMYTVKKQGKGGVLEYTSHLT